MSATTAPLYVRGQTGTEYLGDPTVNAQQDAAQGACSALQVQIFDQYGHLDSNKSKAINAQIQSIQVMFQPGLLATATGTYNYQGID